MAVLTLDKALLIVGVTVVVIVVAYIFRLGQFKRKKPAGSTLGGVQRVYRPDAGPRHRWSS